jgi:hypothetical protein
MLPHGNRAAFDVYAAGGPVEKGVNGNKFGLNNGLQIGDFMLQKLVGVHQAMAVILDPNFFNPANSIEKNIENNLLDEFSSLFKEPDFLLCEELHIRSNSESKHILWEN